MVGREGAAPGRKEGCSQKKGRMLLSPHRRFHCDTVRFTRLVGPPVLFNVCSSVPKTEAGTMIDTVCIGAGGRERWGRKLKF